MATSAVDKIRNRKKKHKIVESLPANTPWAPEGASMVVSTPREIYSIICAIPEEKLITISTIRNYLAEKYNTNIACPVSTGIFINIAARAAEELHAQGDDFAPYWRVLRADGSLNPKYPGRCSKGSLRLRVSRSQHCENPSLWKTIRIFSGILIRVFYLIIENRILFHKERAGPCR